MPAPGEIRHSDEMDQSRKREEKDTRYSRHINNISSKASFGAQPNSYLLQQHQNVLQQ